MFKAGDIVKRKGYIKGSHTKINTNYLVKYCNGNLLSLEGFNNIYFMAENFKLVMSKEFKDIEVQLDKMDNNTLKNMVDEKSFLCLMKKFNMKLNKFKDKKMLTEESLKDKAVVGYDILVNDYSTLTFNFDSNGKYVGVNTIYIDGYESRKNKKKRK